MTSPKLLIRTILKFLLIGALILSGLFFAVLGINALENGRFDGVILSIVFFMFVCVGIIYSLLTPSSRFPSWIHSSYIFSLFLLVLFIFVVCHFGVIDDSSHSYSCQSPGIWFSATFAFLITCGMHWWLSPVRNLLAYLWLFLSSVAIASLATIYI